MTEIKRKYGWRPDVPDYRDYEFSKLLSLKSYKNVELPKSVNLRDCCSPVEDQGSLGSCTANALVGLMEYNQCFNNNQNKNTIDLSRLFVYYNERVLINTIDIDSGAFLRDGIKTLSSDGVCTESDWKYDLNLWKEKPLEECYVKAKNNVISSYYRLNTLMDMKQALANGNPFVFGFSVYSNFESPEVAHTGILNMPGQLESSRGGHAVMCIGYDDDTQRFLVRNSWGTKWGLKTPGLEGHYTMPYEYLTNRNLSDDFWTIII